MPEPGAMCYMMSKQAYFGRTYGNGAPHLMFFVPRTDGIAWGAGLSGSPVIAIQESRSRPLRSSFVSPNGRTERLPWMGTRMRTDVDPGESGSRDV